MVFIHWTSKNNDPRKKWDRRQPTRLPQLTAWGRFSDGSSETGLPDSPKVSLSWGDRIQRSWSRSNSQSNVPVRGELQSSAELPGVHCWVLISSACVRKLPEARKQPLERRQNNSLSLQGPEVQYVPPTSMKNPPYTRYWVESTNSYYLHSGAKFSLD